MVDRNHGGGTLLGDGIRHGGRRRANGLGPVGCDRYGAGWRWLGGDGSRAFLPGLDLELPDLGHQVPDLALVLALADCRLTVHVLGQHKTLHAIGDGLDLHIYARDTERNAQARFVAVSEDRLA